MVETLSKNITRQGLTATTLNYLRVSFQDIKSQVEELPVEGGPAGMAGDHPPGGPPPPPPEGGESASAGPADPDHGDFPANDYHF